MSPLPLLGIVAHAAVRIAAPHVARFVVTKAPMVLSRAARLFKASPKALRAANGGKLNGRRGVPSGRLLARPKRASPKQARAYRARKADQKAQRAKPRSKGGKRGLDAEEVLEYGLELAEQVCEGAFDPDDSAPPALKAARLSLLGGGRGVRQVKRVTDKLLGKDGKVDFQDLADTAEACWEEASALLDRFAEETAEFTAGDPDTLVQDCPKSEADEPAADIGVLPDASDITTPVFKRVYKDAVEAFGFAEPAWDLEASGQALFGSAGVIAGKTESGVAAKGRFMGGLFSSKASLGSNDDPFFGEGELSVGRVLADVETFADFEDGKLTVGGGVKGALTALDLDTDLNLDLPLGWLPFVDDDYVLEIDQEIDYALETAFEASGSVTIDLETFEVSAQGDVADLNGLEDTFDFGDPDIKITDEDDRAKAKAEAEAEQSEDGDAAGKAQDDG
ncbi:MAG: hypothetical protein ACFB2Z_13635 [Maricaulaceae bacterium]